MEVRDERVGGAKAIARRDEDVGLARKGLNAACLVGGALDEAQRGGADGDDAVGRAVDDDEGVVGARRRAEGVELRAPGVLTGVCDDGEDGEDVEVAALVV